MSSVDLVSNLVLFLSIALIIVFILMLLWGFVFSNNKDGFEPTKAMKYGLGVVITIAVFFAVLWAGGWSGGLYNFLFEQEWSSALWTNLIFLVLIGIALAVIVRSKK